MQLMLLLLYYTTSVPETRRAAASPGKRGPANRRNGYHRVVSTRAGHAVEHSTSVAGDVDAPGTTKISRACPPPACNTPSRREA